MHEVFDARLLAEVFATNASISWDDALKVCAQFEIPKPCAPGTFRVAAIAAGGNSFADSLLPPVTKLEGE